jgi:hypothetical protein
MLCIGLVALVAIFGGTPSPKVSGLATAHGVERGAMVGETRVFDIGEEVHMVYDLHYGKQGSTVSVKLTEGGSVVDGADLSYGLSDKEEGRKSLVFVPQVAGSYQALLLLDNQAVEGEEVTFKVVEGGPKLQEVTTARGIDQETYKPSDETDLFDKRDSVHITYRAVEAEVGDTLDIVYYINGTKQEPDQNDHDSFGEAGTFRGFFSISGPDNGSLRTGSYRAELYYNKDLVAVAAFQVK